MRRNLLVLSAIVVALTLMLAAGIMNFAQRRRAEQARMQGMKMDLVPDNGQTGAATSNAPPADDAATDADLDIPENPNTTPLDGKQARNFTLEDLHGQKVSLASFKGRPLVVDFWATWCGPCKIEIPWFEKLHDQYAGQGLEILGVSSDDLDKGDPAKLFTEKRDISDFATKMGMNYPVLIDADSIADQWGGLDALPTTFFIDRNGKIVASTVGLAPRDEIEADIRKAIGSGASS
ncbi:MAG: TlpA disulfide reductase family protein [Acidobacteriaceae bacterium]